MFLALMAWFLNPHFRNPHSESHNLAKAESLVILVQEKLASLKFRPHMVTFMDISKAKFI